MKTPTVELPARYYDAMLDWCNARRAEDKKKPLKKLPAGEAGNPRECPCGKACGWNVQDTYAFRAASPDMNLSNDMVRGIMIIDSHEAFTPVLPIRLPARPSSKPAKRKAKP